MLLLKRIRIFCRNRSLESHDGQRETVDVWAEFRSFVRREREKKLAKFYKVVKNVSALKRWFNFITECIFSFAVVPSMVVSGSGRDRNGVIFSESCASFMFCTYLFARRYPRKKESCMKSESCSRQLASCDFKETLYLNGILSLLVLI